jgi:hypothetical protein
MSNATATTAQVRKHYKDLGCEVRITKDGHVTYRDYDGAMWLEGRWVSEYVIVDGKVVLK